METARRRRRTAHEERSVPLLTYDAVCSRDWPSDTWPIYSSAAAHLRGEADGGDGVAGDLVDYRHVGIDLAYPLLRGREPTTCAGRLRRTAMLSDSVGARY